MPGNCGPEWENLGVGGRNSLVPVAQNGKISGQEVEIPWKLGLGIGNMGNER